MQKLLSLWILLAVGIALVLIGGCGPAPTKVPAAAPAELNVSAAVSLKDSLAEIQKQYQATHPNVKINYNLGASGFLQQQIEQGAPADIFISAGVKQMDELQKKGLINPQSRINLVTNQLVLIVPQQSILPLHAFTDLCQGTVQKFAMGEPTVVPAGQYARQVLERTGLWDDVKAKAVLTKDVRTVLAYVETGNVEAGIVYKTDVASSGKVKIAAAAPAGSHDPIIYPAAILAHTKQPQIAQDFFSYLTGPQGQAVFAKYGFLPAQ